MQWQHALHTLAKYKPYCILKSKYVKECFFVVETPEGLASAKGFIHHILQGQVYDVELGWVDYH